MIRRERKGFWIVIGPYAGRFSWGYGTFGWRERDGWITRRIRKWWSGFHRWDSDGL